MTETEIHECEADCGRPAPTTRMCWDCVDVITTALHDAIEDAHLVRVLGMIGRKEEGAFTLRTQGTTRPAYGPTEPMNLTAIAILQDLTAWARLTASDWSTVENPGWWLHWVPERVTQAQAMVYGEQEPDRADEARHRIKGQALPMPTRRLIPWLHDIGVRVTQSQITSWANRGKISRVDSGVGHPWYSPVDVMRVLHETRP